jgi:NUMOD4 motif/NUMOD1 domain
MNHVKPKTALPAYKDRSLKSRPRERWADIPGMEGYYDVSSFGRIKRYSRDVLSSDGRVSVLPEKIIAPRVMRSPNKYMHDFTYQLTAHLIIDRKRYHLQIRRLVYHCFVEPFELEDKLIYIVSKKGDGLDIRPSNLQKINRQDQMPRVYQKGRSAPTFSAEDILKGVRASAAANGKEISQYDKKGKLIRTYKSLMEAKRESGIGHPQICSAACGREVTAGGFYWRYGHEPRIDIKAFWQERKSHYEERGVSITEYDLAGNPVAHYKSLVSAAEAIGKSASGIAANTRGITLTAYGRRWQKGHGEKKLKPLPQVILKKVRKEYREKGK